jgi:hypothetical protein
MIVDGEQPEIINVREAARRLNRHENTIRNWARSGVLKSAKVPGTSVLSFYARDVDRLRERRGAAVASVQDERRVIGPELVDASQLNQWASTREAQHRFPGLIRRLLASTPGITDISIRAGEGVSAPGWDGQAESSGSAFLPSGSLRFEFGAGVKPGSKAEADYRKRCDDPLGVDPSESVFVFATPRRWQGAAKWASEKQAEGHFADVRVLDADDLEGWLQQTPAVHHWISELLGRRPQDANTMEQWWDRFRARTKPPLPASLFLAGRKEESERLADLLLDSRPQVVVVKATWREEAVAFIWATIERLRNEGKHLQPPLIVKSDETWSRVASEPGLMMLIPFFDDVELLAAKQAGHNVIIPIGWEQAAPGEHIELRRLDRHEATKALESAKLKDSQDAYQLSALARRSLPSLIRKLASNPTFARPAWSQPPDAALLAPLVLVGSWTASDADQAIVSQLVGRPWHEIETSLAKWRNVDDPPFVRPGTQWHLASAQEAFLLFHDLLTTSELQRWEEIAAGVLLERDPKLDLSPDDRPMAQLTGAVRKHSSVLRRGLAQSIALLGTESEPLSDGLTSRDHANRLVRKLLDEANGDTSGKLWGSLADELQLLAEAAPEAFLDAVHADLDTDQPILRLMFQDSEDGSGLFTASPHTGLLWALEVLCWSAAHLSDAARALARLAAIDPGGRLSNRPLNSLSDIFVGWIRHTGATPGARFASLQQINQETPEVAWELTLAIWPSQHATSSPPASPRFHDWKPETRRVSIGDWIDFVTQLVQLAIDQANVNAERWAQLSQRLGPLPPDERERVLQALENFTDSASLSSAEQLTLWEAVDREVARHRRFPSAEWSMSEELLIRMEAIAAGIEPQSDVGRYAYLFDWRPDLPGIGKREEHYEEVLARMRKEAIQDTLESGSIDGLRSLAERSKAHGQLGWTVAEVAPEDLTTELLELLDSDSQSLRALAEGWARRTMLDKGVAWLRTSLNRPEMSKLSRRKALALAAPANSATWDALGDIDPSLSDAYWKEVGIWNVENADVDRAVQELLHHHRPWVAVDLLAFAAHGHNDGQAAEVKPALVAKVLDRAVAAELDTQSQSPGYEVGVLLDYLEKKGYADDELARYEFLFFSLLEHHREPRALYSALRESPDLFIDLVKRVYRGKNERRRQLNERDAALAQHAWRILENWRQVPGRRENGTIDAKQLDSWVQEARLAFADSDRADIGDEQIGAVLSASPEGSDGIWPAEAVRDLIERIGSTSIESGLHVGLRNSRGITSRGVYDGGDQERALAVKYRDWARECSSQWPRTSRMLRNIADSYEREAHMHDVDAEISGDVE